MARRLVWLLLLWPGLAWSQTLPTLPQAWVTVPQVPACDTNSTPANSAALQPALNTAAAFTDALNHCVTLTAGTTYTGDFQLPARGTGATGWVIVRSSNVASLPPQGTQVSPTDGVNMPIVMTTSGLYAMATAPAAHHYWLLGLQGMTNPGLGVVPNSAVLSLDGGATLGIGQSVTSQPNFIFVDRCWIHGTDGEDNDLFGIVLDPGNGAVVDSYINNFKSTTNGETKGILVLNTTGPLKIVNNFLQAGGEIVFIGTDSTPDASYFNIEICDIEIRKNTFSKPIAWRNVYQTKNFLEFKHGCRALIESNLFMDQWAAGQPNTIQLTPRPAGTDVNTIVQDITIRSNQFLRVANPFGFGGTRADAGGNAVGPNPTLAGARVLYQNNLGTDVGYYTTMGADSGDMFDLLANHPSNTTFDHNTFIITTFNAASTMQTKLLNMDGIAAFGPFPGLTYQNSILGDPGTGSMNSNDGSCGGFPKAVLPCAAPGFIFTKNVIVGPWPNAGGFNNDTVTTWPDTGNFFPQSTSNVGFVNFSQCQGTAAPVIQSCLLLASSPYHNAATDGTDIGINGTTFLAALALGNNAYPLGTPATLTLQTTGTGSGAVTGAGDYQPGTLVTITATPSGGSTFAGWSGITPCPQNAATPVSFVMPSTNLTCTATFTAPPPQFTLTVATAGAGNGTTTGQGVYTAGTLVTLTATPSGTSTFSGWSGSAPCPATTTSPATLTMPTNNLTCTATFAVAQPTQITLTINTGGTGSGTTTGAGTYVQNASATVSATASAGSTFAGWSGAAPCPSGTTTPQTITLGTVNLTCTATFTAAPPPTFTLSIVTQGTGTGLTSGAGQYAAGTQVTLSATPTGASSFSGWSGVSPCPGGGTTPITIVMPSANLVCTATFVPLPVPTGTTTGPITIGNCPGIQTNQFPRSLGDQALTVSSTPVSPTVPAGTVFATANVQGKAVKIRGDGGPLTASTGQTWAPNTHFLICGGGIGALQLVRQGNQDAIVYFSFYGP